MKEMRLIDFVNQVPPSRVFLETKQSSYTYGDITQIRNDFCLNYSLLTDRNCAVISEDRESIAVLLPAIDSLCRDVLLLPKDAEKHTDMFFECADIHYVIYLSAGKVRDVKLVMGNTPIIGRESTKAYIMVTSGTTGTPKLVTYNLSALLATSKKDIGRGEEFTWGLTYDVNRFAGLQVYLQTIASGSKLAIPTSSASMHEIIELFQSASVNCLSATPSFWRKLLMEPNSSLLSFKRITLGGEISDQNILTALELSYPSASISHIYASTEAGVGFVVKDKKQGFPYSYLTSESNLSCQLRIINGNLWIKSANGCTKFLRGDIEINDEGFINTGDMVSIERERVIFRGRESGSINVGGNKVMPEKVESVLELHPYVAMAKAFSKHSSVLGSIVACEIVVSTIAKELPLKEIKREVLSFCKEQLQPFEVPALLKIVESIETNATGKKVRN